MSNQAELLREAADAINGSLPYVSSDPALAIRMLRAILAKIDAADGEVPEGFTLVENKALSTARMALAHATTTHGELYRDAYESLLAASGRQDGAR